ncbi:ATP-binding protein [Halioxenophilus sp. WMMB6]|uniref:ATP-binding protein n=1 Tax=Halioxenophilus sp. WMMB6 TaxID=3073815 RepID=UPI00295F2CE3|nr:ATP-binding protein [Halioxenophilus sp. WMMB6]
MSSDLYRSLLRRQSQGKLLYLVLASGLLLAVALYAIHQKARSDVSRELYTYFEDDLGDKHRLLENQVVSIRNQIHFLRELPPIDGIVRATQHQGLDPFDGTELNQWYLRLQTIFSAYLASHPEIAQLRLIGMANNGLELVRVDNRYQRITVASPEEMQTKAHRDYFQNASQLDKDSIYLSPINFNREHGQLDIPVWSTYRAALGVFDNSNRLFGLVVINYRAEPLMQQLQSNLPHGTFYLLNQQGDFLIHPNPSKRFRFEMGQPYTWQNEYGEELPTFDQRHWQDTRDHSRYLATTFTLGSAPNLEQLYLVEMLNTGAFNGLLWSRFTQNAAFVVLFYLIALAITLLYHRVVINQRAMLNAQAHYQAVINCSADAIAILDPSGIIREWNRAAIELLGFNEQDAQSQNFGQWLLPAADLPQYQRLLGDISNGGTAGRLTTSYLRSASGNVEVSISLTGIPGAKGKISHVAVIIHDLSEERSNHRALQNLSNELEAEVAERTYELSQVRDQAIASTRTKSRYLADMSHEIRSPLKSLFGLLNLIRQQPLSLRQASYLELAESSVKSLTDLLDDVLDFSAIEAGKLELKQVEFELKRLLHSVCCAQAIHAQAKGLEFVVDAAGIAHNLVASDPNRLRQILNNVISNAVRFTKRGQICVVASTRELSPRDVWLDIAVQDTGIGIPTEMMAQLFALPSPTSTQASKRGTGLGLVITKQLCDLLGGTIKATSHEGNGSCFTLELPIQPLASAWSEPPLINLSGKTVTIVQNSALAANALAKLLQQWGAQPQVVATIDRLTEQALLPRLDCDLLIVDSDLLARYRQLFRESLEGHGQREEPGYLLITENLSTGESLANEFSRFEHVQLVSKPLTLVNMEQALSGWFAADHRRQQPAEPDNPTNLSGKTVMVVDDNVLHREVVGGILETAGAHLVYAQNGKEAIERIRFGDYSGDAADLVLMDCQMPEMDGFEASRLLRGGIAGPKGKRLPIIAVTAGALSGDREKCLAAGMNDYLSKPIDHFTLLAKAEQWLSAEPSATVAEQASDNASAAAPVATPESNDALWNQQSLLNLVGNSQERLCAVLQKFVESSPNDVDRIRSAQQRGDYQALRQHVHTLKGVCATIGATALANLCAAIEQQAYHSNAEQLAQATTRLGQLHQQLLQSLHREIAEKRA